MEIRKIKASDSRLEISRIYEESWKYAYRGMVPDAYLDSIPAGRWSSAMDTEGRYSLVLLDGDKMIGTSSYSASRFQDSKGWGEIISLYLLPGYCGRGFGKLLLDEAVRGLKDLGFRDIFLYVLEENYRARNFYERYGFVNSNEFAEDDIGGKTLRELKYIFTTE